jgi:hypothetical protein
MTDAARLGGDSIAPAIRSILVRRWRVLWHAPRWALTVGDQSYRRRALSRPYFHRGMMLASMPIRLQSHVRFTLRGPSARAAA